jgi:hypothetical protein
MRVSAKEERYMPGFSHGVHINSPLGLVVFLVLWIVLCECAHILVALGRREPLIGWAISPFGVTLMVLREPSLLYIWLDVFCPAVVSGGVLYIGLYTPLSPLTLPDFWLVRLSLLVIGVVVTSVSHLTNALHDLRYPLWGEARILRTVQLLRLSCARIHFTAFGLSYLRKHFGANPTELLQVLSY